MTSLLIRKIKGCAVDCHQTPSPIKGVNDIRQGHGFTHPRTNIALSPKRLLAREFSPFDISPLAARPFYLQPLKVLKNATQNLLQQNA